MRQRFLSGSLLLAGILLGLAPAGAAAQTKKPQPAAASASQRIGYVNWQFVLQQIPAYAQAESIYNRVLAPYQREITGLQTALDSVRAELLSASDKLQPAEQAARRKALAAQRDSVDQRTSLFRADASALQQTLFAPLEERVRAVLESVRAEGHFGLVIDVSAVGQGIVAADSSLNLTNRLLRRIADNR